MKRRELPGGGAGAPPPPPSPLRDYYNPLLDPEPPVWHRDNPWWHWIKAFRRRQDARQRWRDYYGTWPPENRSDSALPLADD